jgi:hypothetical protein
MDKNDRGNSCEHNLSSVNESLSPCLGVYLRYVRYLWDYKILCLNLLYLPEISLQNPEINQVLAILFCFSY